MALHILYNIFEIIRMSKIRFAICISTNRSMIIKESNVATLNVTRIIFVNMILIITKLIKQKHGRIEKSEINGIFVKDVKPPIIAQENVKKYHGNMAINSNHTE